MLAFPQSTTVHRKIPKEAFYKHMTLSGALKEKFVAQVDRIFVENSLTQKNLNLGEVSPIKEILLLVMTLKKQEFDGKIAEAIARQNPHKLVFLLQFEGEGQLAIYHGRLYCTTWMKEENLKLNLEGSSIDSIWEHMIEQIALKEEKLGKTKTLTMDERLARQAELEKLTVLIEKTERAVWKEKQPKKKFALYQKLQEYKKRLEETAHG